MKKLIALMMLCFATLALAACEGFNMDQFLGGQTPAAATQEQVDGAAEMLYTLNNPGKNNKIPATLEKYSVIEFDGLEFDVEWSVEGIDSTLVWVTEGTEEENTVIINAKFEAEEDTEFKLVAVVSNGELSKRVEFTYVMKALTSVVSIADFIASDDTENAQVLQGIVTAVNGIDEKNSFVLTDASGSIFCYDKELDVDLGDEIKVSCVLGYNSDLPQIASPLLVELVSTGNDVSEISGTPVEYEASTIKADLASMNGPALVEKYSGQFLAITGYMIADGDYANMAAERTDTTKCINVYANKTLNVSDYVGEKVVLYGFMRGKGTGYLTIQVQGIEVVNEELTPEQEIQKALTDVKVQATYTENTEVTLPATLEENITLTWELVGEAVEGLTISEGKLVVTQGSAMVKQTLKVTATRDGVSCYKEFELTVLEATKFNLVVNPVAGVPYKLGVYQGNTEKQLYFGGKLDGNFGVTGIVPTAASDVYLEEVTGGYNMYVLDGETKTYINAASYTNSSNKTSYKLVLSETATSVYTYNFEYNTMVTVIDSVELYIGTYSTYETLSVSKLSFASTSFVSHFYQVAAPEVGIGHTLSLVQGNAEGTPTLYFTGSTSGTYLATSATESEAALVFLEYTTGGYSLYVKVDNAKQYINAKREYNESKGKYYQNLYLESTASTVWTYNQQYNTMVTVLEDVEYYMGTYGTFTTISLSSLNFAATSFVSHLEKAEVNIEVNNKLASLVKEELTALAEKTLSDDKDLLAVVNLANHGKGDIKITWTNAEGNEVTKITYTQPAEETKVVATAKFAIDGVEHTQNVEFKLAAYVVPTGKTITLTTSSLNIGSAYGDSTATIDGVSFDVTHCGDYGNGIQMRIKDGNASGIKNTTALASKIEKIVFTFNADKSPAAKTGILSLTFGTSADSLGNAVALDTVAGQYEYTVIPTGDYTFFSIDHTTVSGSLYWDSIVIYLAE